MEREQQTRLLDEQGKKDARGLWEEIFQEDTKMFLDYYDRWKLPENECFGIYGEDGRLDSMVQLNPYRLRVKGREAESRYIIAVATRPERRHKGLMRRLLKESLEYMRRKAMPFAFLMPASDAIYRPFDFRYFYTMNTGVIGREEPRGTLRAAEASPAGAEVRARAASRQDIPELIRFYEETAGAMYDCCTVRDVHYFEMLFAELESEKGGMLLIYEGRRIAGCLSFWGLEEPEIRELLCRPEDREMVLEAVSGFFGGRLRAAGASVPLDERKPVIMGRIADAEAFLRLFGADRPMTVRLSLTDPFLEENTGIWMWHLSPGGSAVRRAGRGEDGELRAETDAAGLFQWLSGAVSPGDLMEAGLLKAEAAGTGTVRGILSAVRVCRAPWLNEIV